MAELKVVSFSKIRIPDVRVSSILDPEQKAILASTVKEIGVVQDPVVRRVGPDEYELIAGKSRLTELAAQGANEAQVKVIEADDALALIMNIVENVARGTYDYVSISRSIRKLKALGKSPEELERIFPWRKRWIDFIEGLQDLPNDVTDALSSRIIKPTHVQLALNLPTPHEVHSGLRTAITHEWDTGTFKIFVENRVEQIAVARKEAGSKGIDVEIPEAIPEQLIRYKQCLVCGFQKPSEKVTVQLVCEGCMTLAKYITDQLGPPEDAIQTIYGALKAYFGSRPAPGPESRPPPGD